MSLRRGPLFALALICLAAVLTTPAAAQTRATLVADSLEITGDATLRATGNVEVLYEGRRLTAPAVSYNADRDELIVEGPLRLQDGDNYVIVASAAELDDGFRNGLIRSARLVLEQQLQIAANEINRVNGRYTQLYRAVASTCQVCDESEVPLWQIRATRIIHDAETRQLYLDNAVFQVYGIPIMYVPRLRFPDPSVERTAGFLTPRLRISSILKTGVELPYFLPVSDHADLTLTPYVSPETRTVKLRHRKVWTHGATVIDGALSDDTLQPEGLRSYAFARGRFFTPLDYRLDFNLRLASDQSYLSDYGFYGEDRLRSDVEVSRVSNSTLFRTEGIYFRTFRDTESNATIPSEIATLRFLRRLPPGALGGTARLRFEAYGFTRDSQEDIIGRDYGRISGQVGWQRATVFGPGFEFSADAEANLDFYSIGQDSTDRSRADITPIAAGTLRWPLSRTDRSGAAQLLEPTAQVVWVGGDVTDLTDEEGALVDLDEGNLFAFSRIPGRNRYERGLRANFGLDWARYDPSGWTTSATIGRIFRNEDLGQFAAASGLDGTSSDWLGSVQVLGPNGFRLTNRALIDDDGSLTKNEASFRFNYGKFDVSGGHLWLIAEPEVDRDIDSSEFALNAGYRASDRWAFRADTRWDFIADRAASAGASVSFVNECIEWNAGVRRNFTSSTAVRPNTEFTLSFSLIRGGGNVRATRQKCYG